MKLSTGFLLCAAMLGGLTVLPIAGCDKARDTAGGGTKATAEVSDFDVSTKVKTALLRDENLKGLAIAVVTIKGDVRLTGVLDNQAQIDQAIALARSVEGVHAIHDELTLKK